MNYIGSKQKLSDFIKTTIYNVVGNDLSQTIFCDLFAGTGIVGRNFKKEVKQVIANDFEYYSFVLNKNYIGNHLPITDQEELINQLNSLPLIENGFIYQNYCLGSGSERQYFSDFNGKKIDTIRSKIAEWKNLDKIDDNQYYFLLASLLESADKVANTASVYGAFLKKLKKSAQKDLILQPASFDLNNNEHIVFNKNSNDLIKEIKGDILYLDPPYNARQYGANYHLLNTIAKYEKFEPKGKTGLPEYQKSKYCSKNTVLNEFEYLIKSANFEYIFLSYNNEGLMSSLDIQNIMSKYGEYSLEVIDYQRFKADSNRYNKTDTTQEFLHILKKKRE
ncbi:DNA adenine methylase [Phocoenobacter skyensis]|uniref:site-specific DNA-methyltransferase (adenine-specific) n=1 Tax=Phocoenobacter skyensis TaxID=97481 RepID=A0AAJ6NCV1_9PAST|nr:DNA adenine methylase [Pasteurella skyensis]MDP8174478.1 DNA adenine methylase [Pasteurella skyensis]